jgi:uncharacterized membrane protein YbhN (UPF0104 family)
MAAVAIPFIRKTGLRHIASMTTWPIVATLSIVIVTASILSGISVFLLIEVFFDVPQISLFQVICGFALSWVIGFVVPGAPGGVGIREATFVLLFRQSMPESVALQVIVLFRLVTIAADLILYALVSTLLGKWRHEKNDGISPA